MNVKEKGGEFQALNFFIFCLLYLLFFRNLHQISNITKNQLTFCLLFFAKKSKLTAEKVSGNAATYFLQLVDYLLYIYKKVSKVSKVSVFIYIYRERDYIYINGFDAYFFYFAYFFSLTCSNSTACKK